MRGDEFKVGKLLIVNALSILRNKMSLAKWKIRGIYNRKRKFCEFSLYFILSDTKHEIMVFT